MDFHEGWLQQQTPKDREIIRELAMGSTQSEVARKFGVTPACINSLPTHLETHEIFFNGGIQTIVHKLVRNRSSSIAFLSIISHTQKRFFLW
jgi:hypothetical protein